MLFRRLMLFSQFDCGLSMNGINMRGLTLEDLTWLAATR
jgi:hypothetical protein